MDVLEKKVSAHSHLNTLSGFFTSACSYEIEEALKDTLRKEFKESHKYLSDLIKELGEVVMNQREVIDGLREENTSLTRLKIKQEVKDG